MQWGTWCLGATPILIMGCPLPPPLHPEAAISLDCLGANSAGALLSAKMKCRSNFVLQFKELKEQGVGRGILSDQASCTSHSPARAQGHITPAAGGWEEPCRAWNLNWGVAPPYLVAQLVAPSCFCVLAMSCGSPVHISLLFYIFMYHFFK